MEYYFISLFLYLILLAIHPRVKVFELFLPSIAKDSYFLLRSNSRKVY